MITIKSTRSLAARTAVVARLVPSDALERSGVDAKLLARLGFTGEDGSSVTVTGDTPAITLLVGVGASDRITAELSERAIRRGPGAGRSRTGGRSRSAGGARVGPPSEGGARPRTG